MAPLLIGRADAPVQSSTTTDVLTALIAFSMAILVTVGAVLLVRRYRRSSYAAGLPLHHGPTESFDRSRSVFVFDEKHDLIASTSGPENCPLPEIRITFPEEVDDSGKHQKGRVVIVHVGDKGEIGLAPVDDNLPAYQQNASDRFQSLDLDRLGGLKEKAINA